MTDRVQRMHEKFKAETEAKRISARNLRAPWQPRPPGSIPPLGPEHAADLARLMDVASPGTTDRRRRAMSASPDATGQE